MELGIEAARWVVSKALGPASGGVLEAWAASSELGHNIRELRMELLYAHGVLNNARAQEIQNPALTELLQELRGLGYMADDVMDELEYFRIQDELHGTYHAADEHGGGCLRNQALNARHTARAIAKRLVGFSKSSSSPAARDDDDQEEEDATQSRAVLCGAFRPCGGRAASSTNASPSNQEQEDGCMTRLSSCVRNTISTPPGKHIPAAPPQREHAIPKLKFDRVDMSRRMKEIVEQLKPVCAKVSTILNLELLDSNRNTAQAIAASLNAKTNGHTSLLTNSNRSRPVTTSEPVEPKLYGREVIKSNINRAITEGEDCDKDLTILPIVGPGGIGKTTLAQYIYKELQNHFDVKLWVCVSVNFNVYRLTQEIADSLNTNGQKGSPDKLVEEGLKSKKFLLVLDDMWNCSDEDEWKRFLVPFRKGPTKGSVILVTTRFPALAQIVKTTSQWIDLAGLDDETFKELFFAYVFGDQSRNDNIALIATGDEIMKKLKGSPLAAKTVGRLLRNNLDLDHWTRVLESREWESQTGEHDIMPALKLSFDYLPFHLQQCFSYCGLFPEDYRFGREELIHLWIGLDVLHSSQNETKSIEDIGLSNLKDLVNHGFFKMEEEYGDTCYVIHDLLHQLALKVSAHECLSIYSSNVSSIEIPLSIRHLSLNIDDSSVTDKISFDVCKEDFSVLNKRLRVDNLQSLMLFGEYQSSFVKTFCGLLREAKALRVIFLSEKKYSMEDLLPNYLNLVHLRYLRISGVFESRLCKNISRYYHLRVLDLRRIYYSNYDLPGDMSNLAKLQHFLVSDNTMHVQISNLGRLKSLKDLERFVVKKESQGFELKQIGHLFELCGSLYIENLGKVESREEAAEAKLMHKKHLHKLILNWDTDLFSKDDPSREEEVIEGLKPNSNLSEIYIMGHGGTTCPSWLGVNLSVENLDSLSLNNVAWKTFPPIGKLQVNAELPSGIPNRNFHKLRRIELVKLGVKKWVVDSTSQFYSCLEELKIKGCYEFRELSFSSSACSQQEQNIWFPKLKVLEIIDCPELSSLPPVPWTRDPCSIEIREVGLGFQFLYFGKDYTDTELYLQIEGKVGQNTCEFWMALEFDHLIELNRLEMDSCPPLPLDRLKMLSSLKCIKISNSSNVFWLVEEGRRVQCQFPIETITITNVGTSGKELTRVLTYMSKLLELYIYDCQKITGLGVVEQKEKTTPSMNRRGFSHWMTRLGSLAGRLVPWSLDGQFPIEVQDNTREEEEMKIAQAEDGLLFLPPQLQALIIDNCLELSLRPDHSAGGLQGLHSLRSLQIVACPMFFSLYLASSASSCSPFPTSLQELYISGLSLTVEGKTASLSNLASLTELDIRKCEGCEGFWRHLPRGCLTRFTVLSTSSFFLVDPPGLPSQLQQDHDGLPHPFWLLHSLNTNDVTGLFVAPICSLLSSSLTKLELYDDRPGIESFTKKQEEALQLLTSLQDLRFCSLNKLQCLPAGMHGLPRLKTLFILDCQAIRTLPVDGFPNSLQELVINGWPATVLLPKGALPNSLQTLEIRFCKAIRSLPKDGLPNSLQELVICFCPAIRTLPKGGLPSSLRRLNVQNCGNEELKRHCRKLIGTIPIVEVDP